MGIVDTSILIDFVNDGKKVDENITFITVIEYPMVLEYGGFTCKILYPDEADFILALELQSKLRKSGRMKSASDLIIAAICINNKEKLLTSDSDFDDVANISNLQLA